MSEGYNMALLLVLGVAVSAAEFGAAPAVAVWSVLVVAFWLSYGRHRSRGGQQSS